MGRAYPIPGIAMRVTLVAPTYFSPQSIIGGGERYVAELARNLAKRAEVQVLTFGKQSAQWQQDGVNYRCCRSHYWKHFNLSNPWSISFGRYLKDSDVVHTHQVCTWVADWAALHTNADKQALAGTDHGGGGAWVLNRKLNVFSRYQAVVAQSQKAGEHLAHDFPASKIVPIPGGVDAQRYCPDKAIKRSQTVLFVGRLKPHKGVDVLLEAFKRWAKKGYSLELIGRRDSPQYQQHLEQLAVGLPVRFIHEADDDQVLAAYRRAQVLVLPSVEKDCYGKTTSVAELMGFTLLEAQACGTPVICSDAGAMAEFVAAGTTGLVARQADPDSLALALEAVSNWWENNHNIEESCVTHASRFTWVQVVEQHINLYKQLLSHQTTATVPTP